MSLSDIGCERPFNNMLHLAIALEERSSFSLLFKIPDRVKVKEDDAVSYRGFLQIGFWRRF